MPRLILYKQSKDSGNSMLYLRHADKEYANGGSDNFSLDPGITESGRVKIREKIQHLVRSYGLPSKLISSPYLRARQTAEEIHDIILGETDESIEIYYDPVIGEYLGNQTARNINVCLHPETLKHNPIPPENWNQYVGRVARHKRNTEYLQDNVWYISHGVVIQSVAHFYGSKINYPGPLEGIHISNGTIETF
ncbi:Hypothetical protein HVR_LOCUS41 [uncultured virus]|nr:Hypothetical protein HVR_LOCUS41 [uncultured virus]